MDLATHRSVAFRPPTLQCYKTWTRLWTTWKLSSYVGHLGLNLKASWETNFTLLQYCTKGQALPCAPACSVAVHTTCQLGREEGDPDRSERRWSSRMCLAPCSQPINPQPFFSMPEDSSWTKHKAGSGLARSVFSLGSAMC